MKTMNTHRLILSPSDVRRDFPNALLADGFRKVVEEAESDGRSVEVLYADAIWGLTVLEMKAVVLG